MNVSTIKKRDLTINDERICGLIKKGNIEYLHFFLVDDTGGVSMIAKPPSNDELTLGKNYKKLTTGTDSVSFRTPKQLRDFAGKKVWCYFERLHPEPGELFRIKPIDFHIRKLPLNLKSQTEPYFMKNYLVLPHHYLNEHIDHTIKKLQVSFDRSVPEALAQNYLFAFLSDGRFMGRKRFYFLEKRRNSLRTKTLTKFIEYLKCQNKSINNYQYDRTLPLKSCPYGLIVFKEVLQNG